MPIVITHKTVASDPQDPLLGANEWNETHDISGIAISDVSGLQTALDSKLSNAFETISKNLKSYPYVLNYTDNALTSIVYDLGGGDEITKTLNYTGADLTSIVLSGDTPAGIDLTKTLSYTNGDLTGIEYS
jgi:hypothetical protein